jgi:hypothetical protein
MLIKMSEIKEELRQQSAFRSFCSSVYVCKIDPS